MRSFGGAVLAFRTVSRAPRWALGGLVFCLAGGLLGTRELREPAVPARRGVERVAAALLAWAGPEALESEADEPFVTPTGAPPALGCAQARTITSQVRSGLAAPAGSPDAVAFGESVSDWLDPHGLWSVAPDSPVGPLLRRRAAELLAEIQASPTDGSCPVAAEIGGELARWSARLRDVFDEGYRNATSGPPLGLEGFRRLSTSPFEDGPVTRPATTLARTLGRDAGLGAGTFGDALSAHVQAVRERTTPTLSPEAWALVVLAAAVRAYVPQVDAHGAWAPLDEEVSIYDLELETAPPLRLWTDMTRTTLGVRIEAGALPPLVDGDLVLQIERTSLAGMSVEQTLQIAVLEGEPKVRVTVLRAREAAPIELVVSAVDDATLPPAPPRELPLAFERYGDGRAAIVTIADVPDNLGDELGRALADVRREDDVCGLVLDLRANGGGSTDGAADALGYFLPGATLFPMRRRDGGVEVERAPDVPREVRWNGPLAVLVDGDSASAAEMIAGALGAYGRAVVIGERTYGKGCAQEYLDDDAHAGVLRLTTLLYALPDGAPVQKVGISPDVGLSLPGPTEREASVTRALGPWQGPDVRDPLTAPPPWPSHAGRVGPCRDEVLCRALRVLGTSRAVARHGG